MNDTCKILVVDDDEGFRDVMTRQLSRLGYACAPAAGGAKALEAFEEDDYDIAFIDLVMPDMDGMALLRAMNEADLDTVPVVLSGRATVSTAVEAMKCGAFDCMGKESDMGILRSTVERAATHRRVKRHARQMSEMASQWEATFDAVPDLMAIIDTQHRFVRVNKALAEKLDCTPQEAVGRTCCESFHGIEAPTEDSPHAQLLEDNQACVARVAEERFGGHFLVTSSPLHDSNGKSIGSVHVARDVTEERAAEEELRKANMETERLVSSMSSFLIEVDGELRVRRWNVATERTFGIPAAQVLGKPFVDSGIQWNWDIITPGLQEWLTTSQPIRLQEVRYVRPDGVEGVLGLTVNPIGNGGRQSLGFFLTGADITERKALEVQLVQAQKLESIGQLAAGIAHEINTPTQYVGDNIEFLECAFGQLEELRVAHEKLLELAEAGNLQGTELAEITATVEETDVAYLVEQIPRAITQSLEGVGRIASIVKAMKEFSHPGTEEKTCIDLNRAIESTITVSRNEWKYVAEMETDLDAGLPQVPCLPGEFNQVVLNILVNASHAIADVTENGSNGKGTITGSTCQDGNWAEVRITDTGTGIPEKARARIFDPFYTTKDVGKGTGQGLAIAHNVIVEKHGGTLTFETEMREGTTFVIRIPISEEQ